jgi:hypothetical protein
MKKLLLLLAALTLVSFPLWADDDATGPTVKSAVAVDQNTKPTDTFTADTPQLMVFFLSKGTVKGDKFRMVWIATDVGSAAPPNTTINDSTKVADSDDYGDGDSLSKPTNGWPLGKYRVEVYLNDKLASTSEFTINAAATQ